MLLKYIGVYEYGINFADQEGKIYHWQTKSYSSEFFFMRKGEEINITAELFQDNHLKNVRKVK